MMQNQGPTGSMPPVWSHRLKGAQFGFIAGIVIGLIFGWIFHGIISFAFQFGLLALLLLPIIVIGWLWFRSQRAPAQGRQQANGPRTGSLPAVIDVQQPSAPVRDQWARDASGEADFVDVPLIRPTEQRRPTDIEAELEALKRESERGA